MKNVAWHLLMATAGMTLWAWVVIETRAHSALLVCLIAGTALTLTARWLFRTRRRKEKALKKIRMGLLLTVAGALALLAGQRVSEAVVLDPDNMTVSR